MRDISEIQTLFSLLIGLQFLLIVVHALVDIPGFIRGSQVRAVVGNRKFWLGTLSTAIFPTIAVALVVAQWGQPKSEFSLDYWLVYTAITVSSAIGMWWVPYFFGASEETKRDYLAMYARTLQILPRRGDNPRPNLAHILFHLLFLSTLVLAALLRLAV